MPGRNGTGPLGQGSTTGRAQGICNGSNADNTNTGMGFAQGRGFGMGIGRGICRMMGLGMAGGMARGMGKGFGRAAGLGKGLGKAAGLDRTFASDPLASQSPKETLSEQKRLLQNRLYEINQQLEDMEGLNK